MTDKLQLPLDTETAANLQKLGRYLIRSKLGREKFIKNRQEVMAKYGLQNVDLSHVDERVLGILIDPAFSQAIEKRNVQDIRKLVQEKMGVSATASRVGLFDFDFDVEVEVEVGVIAIAVAVFVFAGIATSRATRVELERRRTIVAEALQSLHK